MEYKVKVEEISRRTVIIEADNEEQAEEIASELYYNQGEINLDYDDFSEVNIEVQGKPTQFEKDLFDKFNLNKD